MNRESFFCGFLSLFLLVGLLAAAGNSGWLLGCSGQPDSQRPKDGMWQVGNAGWVTETGFRWLHQRDARCDSLEYLLKTIGSKLTADGIHRVLEQPGYRDLWMEVIQ